jgi:glutaredoxin
MMKKTIIRSLVLAAPLAALFVSLPGLAQYKVVSPDGRVTYTDTPPSTSGGSKVTKLGERISIVSETPLPIELRQPASRYPVTLYTTKTCPPCDAGRQLLRQRGIPFNEKLVVTGPDVEALERLTGARQAPALTIGAQALSGLASDSWNAYLDSAGYPRESKLPANYQYPAAAPLTEPPAPVARQGASDAPRAEPAPIATPTTSSPSGIRF